MARGVAVASTAAPAAVPDAAVELRWRGRVVRGTIAVGGGKAPPPLTVLATGTVDAGHRQLPRRRLGAARVRSDVHPGTGLVKPGGPWENLAAFQVRVVRQDVTVISIGPPTTFACEPSTAPCTNAATRPG